VYYLRALNETVHISLFFLYFTDSNFVLGSAQEKNDYPIVYCSDGFCELTGFTRSDLMRRSCACNFLYGLESNKEDIQNIENALKTQKELKKEILFYKKNGEWI
jgi:potassium voltage-gated channel Eag-related subfamily H protein 8